MVQISKRMLKPEVMEKIFNLLFNTIGKQTGEKQFTNIINGILSPVEKIVVAKRVAIMFLILKDIECRNIRDILKVSLGSISKCQMIILNNQEMKRELEIIINNKEVSTFLEELFLTFFGPGTAYTNWKKAWKRKIALENKKSQEL